MQQIQNKSVIFLVTVFFAAIIVGLIANNLINHYPQSINTQNLQSSNIIPTQSGKHIDINSSLPDLFLANVASNFPKIPQIGTFEYILLRKYGAVFVNKQPEVKLPTKVIFTNEQETQKFQSNLTMSKVHGMENCYLQKSAADALNKVEVQVSIPINTGDGFGDCTRSYATNLKFWQNHTDNTTLEKVEKGEDEEILSVVAPPGCSQHLWGLAIDLHITKQVQRDALSQNGWFQTIEDDTPHWTYLGLPEEKLPTFGLQKKVTNEITYWITPL